MRPAKDFSQPDKIMILLRNGNLSGQGLPDVVNDDLQQWIHKKYVSYKNELPTTENPLGLKLDIY